MRYRYARWRLKPLVIAIAGIAVLLAGATKWTRYAELRRRIANLSREEDLLLFECQEMSRIKGPCGNPRRQADAYRGVIEERRRCRAECEQQLRCIW